MSTMLSSYAGTAGDDLARREAVAAVDARDEVGTTLWWTAVVLWTPLLLAAALATARGLWHTQLLTYLPAEPAAAALDVVAAGAFATTGVWSLSRARAHLAAGTVRPARRWLAAPLLPALLLVLASAG